MNLRLAILYQSPELLVVNKPADLVCHPTKGDEYSSLVSRARLHLGPASHPQLVNRLDRETSGVIVFACETAAARELRQIWERRCVQKNYLAIVHGWVNEDSGNIEAPLGPDDRSKVAIKDCVRADGAPATTGFKVLRRFHRELPSASPPAVGRPEKFSLLDVRPTTGRKHQIRIHLAHIGHAIVGDKIYGPDEDCYLALVERRLSEEQRRTLVLPFQALHASKVSFEWRNKGYSFSAEPESWFVGFCDESHSLMHPGLV